MKKQIFLFFLIYKISSPKSIQPTNGMSETNSELRQPNSNNANILGPGENPQSTSPMIEESSFLQPSQIPPLGTIEPTLKESSLSRKRSRENSEEKDEINESRQKAERNLTEKQQDSSKKLFEEEFMFTLPSQYICPVLEEEVQKLKDFITPPFKYSTKIFVDSMLSFLSTISKDFNFTSVFSLGYIDKMFLFIRQVRHEKVFCFKREKIIESSQKEDIEECKKIKYENESLYFLIKYSLNFKKNFIKTLENENTSQKKMYKLSQFLYNHSEKISYLDMEIGGLVQDITELTFLIQDSAMQSIIYQGDKFDDFQFSIIENIKLLVLLFYLKKIIVKNSQEICKFYSELSLC